MRPSLALALVACAVLTLPAAAQEPPPKPDKPEREGLMGGFGLGLGSLRADCPSCSDAVEAGGIDAHLGGMLSPKIGLMGEFWVMAHTEDDVTISQTLLVAALQFWVTQRFWLKGGVGGASVAWRWDGPIVLEDRTETTLGIMAALGFEAVSKPNFAFDIQLRFGTGFYRDESAGYDVQAHSASLTFGFNWF